MALKDFKETDFNLSQLPDIKPLGSPVGRFEASPLADTKMGDLQTKDIFAGEGIGGLDKYPDVPEPAQIPTEIDGVMVNPPTGRHYPDSQHQGTYGTGKINSLSENDPFGNL